jgi:hypothetical protein
VPTITRRTSTFGFGCFLQGLGILALIAAIATVLTVIGPIVFGLLGLWLIFYGAAISEWYECSDCGTRLSHSALKICPNCSGAFPAEKTSWMKAIGLTPIAIFYAIVLAILCMFLIPMLLPEQGANSPQRTTPSVIATPIEKVDASQTD